MKLLFILLNLALSVANASQRPSIFDMPGVEKPAVSETYENNPCYQKLISLDPATGRPFAETLYSQLIQRIHKETNIPIETIHQLYAEQYPGKTPKDIIVELSKYGFKKCYSPETILSKFKEELKTKLNVTVNSDTVSGIREELVANGFIAIERDTKSWDPSAKHSILPENTDTRLYVKHPNNQFNIFYEYTAPGNSYFTTKTEVKNATSHSLGITPDSYYDLQPQDITSIVIDNKYTAMFYNTASHIFKGKYSNLIKQTREESLSVLKKKLEDGLVQLSINNRIPFVIQLFPDPYLRAAENKQWQFNELNEHNKNSYNYFAAKKNETGNFTARHLCNDRQECGSVVIEEEAIHKAYHDYLRNKQNLTIVDLGSSVGFNSIRYTLSDNRVILCDRSFNALGMAASYMYKYHPDKAGNLYLTTQSADQLTLPKNSVDVVFMGYLIKYFPGKNIDQMLQNIFNYLKPGGKLFLAEIPPDNGFYQDYRNGPPPPLTLDSLYLGTQSPPYKIPFPEPSPHWSGEIGATHNSEDKFEYNLTKVTEDDVIKGLERAGFRIEENLSTSTAAKNYTHMPGRATSL